MGRLMYYHHPCADTFSLTFSSTSVADVVEQRREADGKTKLIGYPFETPIYALYESTEASEAASDIDYGVQCFEE